MCVIASGLNNNKSSGSDGIPAEFFKYAPTFIFEWLAVFISSVLTHSHVPCSLTDIIVKPVVKNCLNNPTDSGNYRPIALASSASQIIEKIIYDRLMAYIVVSDSQFGFKQNHSTDQCIFALKQTEKYYSRMNTPVFGCLIDIKSAFDRVSQSSSLKN